MRPTLFNFLTTPEEQEKHLSALWSFLLKGGHDAPFTVYDLKDVAKAHQDLEGRKTTGKLLLKP
jgi:NADPH:quinone reductase